MKRTRFIALALVVAIMLMGAGYAAWDETIQVRGTVDTGTVDVSIVVEDYNTEWTKPRVEVNRDTTTTPQTSANWLNPEWVRTDERPDDADEYAAQWIDADCDVDEGRKSATFEFSNMYPGAGARYYLELNNGGTLPVRFTGVDVSAEDSDGVTIASLDTANHLLQNLDVKYTIARTKATTGWPYDNIVNGTCENISLLEDSIADGIAALTTQEELVLYPRAGSGGDQFKVTLEFFMPHDEFGTEVTENADGVITGIVHEGEDEGIELEVLFNFEQAPETADKDI